MRSNRFHHLLIHTAFFAFALGFISVFLLRYVQTTKAQDVTEALNKTKPNIILILADDLDKDSIQYMPKLKQLLTDKGVSFDNYFVSLSLCCPSRVTTLRGQYAHNHTIISNGLPNGGFTKAYTSGIEKSTVATWLKNANYDTVLIGKYLNKYPDGAKDNYIPPGWTQWFGSVGGGTDGYDHWINENGTVVHYTSTDDYATDVYSRLAVRFIKNSGNKPFFLYIAPNAPHNPATPAKRHEDLFPNIQTPQTPSFNEEDVSDKPEWVKSLPLLSLDTITNMDLQYRNRIRSLQAVDDMIEKIVFALTKNGKLDNTYIFFTSDNGFHMGQHRLGPGKNSPYEEDIRLPLIVRGPKVTPNTTESALAGNVDLAPTFARLAGAKIPSFVDGRSFASYVGVGKRVPPAEWRQEFLIEGYADTPDTADETPYAEPAGGVAKPAFSAIRSQNFMFIEYANGEKEYYDLSIDPYQLDNKASSLNPDMLTKFSAKVNELKTCTSDACRNEETKLP